MNCWVWHTHAAVVFSVKHNNIRYMNTLYQTQWVSSEISWGVLLHRVKLYSWTWMNFPSFHYLGWKVQLGKYGFRQCGHQRGQILTDTQFWLETDTSGYATRAVLSQLFDDSKWHPVGFTLKSLTKAEKNYEVHNQELLLVIWGLEEWRHVLEGTMHMIKLLNNHRNLMYFQMSQKLNHRQACWSLFLSIIDFSLTNMLGQHSAKPDALSLLACVHCTTWLELGVQRGLDVGFSLCAASTHYHVSKYFKQGSGAQVQRFSLRGV